MDKIQEIGTYIVALAVVAAVTILAWHGTVNGEAALALLSAVGGAGVSVGATKSGAKIANTSAPTTNTD